MPGPLCAVVAPSAVWTCCFMIVDDPFASREAPLQPWAHGAGDPAGAPAARDGRAPPAVGGAGRGGANLPEEDDGEEDEGEGEEEEGRPAGEAGREGGGDNQSSGAAPPLGNGTGASSRLRAGQAWLTSLEKNASRELLRRAERLRNTSREQMRRKRMELRQKGAQLHNASVDLASAISSGQFLSAARGTLQEKVRLAVTRTLPVSLAPNELVTRPYASWLQLIVRVGLDFLNEPVLATWSKSDPWRVKKINLLVLLLNFAYTLVQEVRAQVLAARHDADCNSARCCRVSADGGVEEVLSKDVGIGDVLRLSHGDLCPANGEVVQSSHSFVLFNSLCETGEDCCSVLRVGDSVLRGFVLALEGCCVLVQVTETRNAPQQPEDGPPVLDAAGAAATAGGATSPSTHKSGRMERFPEHMNSLVMRANLAALAILFCDAVLVCTLCYHGSVRGSDQVPAGTESSQEQPQNDLSTAERLLVTHFFSAAVQMNSVIPSMRWVVLFFLFVFLLERARPEVSVQNWKAFRGLEQRRILYSDKTGTLTEVGMHVARLRVAATGVDLSRSHAPRSGVSFEPREASEVSWLVAVLMACNDCQPRPAQSHSRLGPRPGTSPEEVALAEHLEDALGVRVGSNPLRPGSERAPAASGGRPPPPRGAVGAEVAMHRQPLVLLDAAGGEELARACVLSRGNFDPAQGCREARLAFETGAWAGARWLVRQGGADVMAELAGRSARDAEFAAEDRDRALGWSVARLGADGERAGAWHYVLRASFANPPRAESASLVAHCKAAGVAVRMLTGDACTAALHISRQIGIISESSSGEGHPVEMSRTTSGRSCACVCYTPGEPPAAFSARVDGFLSEHADTATVCVAVPGSVLREQILASMDGWLANEVASAVIYRTRAADKALIVRRTEELGRTQRRRAQASAPKGLVSRKLQCMGPRFGPEGVCFMLGDAANDAEAISLDGIVGVSLRHGATPCKLGADFVVDGPAGLVSIRTELFGRALAGAQWLLGDVCTLCGMVSALTLCGIWAGGFTFLPRGFLYDDPFDARIMSLFSGGLYPLSACAAACRVGSAAPAPAPAGAAPGPAAGSAWPATKAPAVPAPSPVRSLVLGVLFGGLMGLAGPSEDPVRFGRWILSVTSSTCFLRHAAVQVSCGLGAIFGGGPCEQPAAGGRRRAGRTAVAEPRRAGAGARGLALGARLRGVALPAAHLDLL
ncbi:unnamed protein product [Prorocentrum cordatum]|uniref:P-type ATPase A domain-containing protein n=1 Tax=Prorocentrum cordatum TaxID=2364126 RepID=A0ABN9RJE4_9DINO|nr:unnamed protein product [Polarella glacialis]